MQGLHKKAFLYTSIPSYHSHTPVDDNKWSAPDTSYIGMRSDQARKDGGTSPRTSKDGVLTFGEAGTAGKNTDIADKNAASMSMQAILSGDFADPAKMRGKYALEQLKNSKASDPSTHLKDVDPTKKEQYLSDADWSAVKAFDGVGRVEFEKLAKWKRDKMKKAAGLF